MSAAAPQLPPLQLPPFPLPLDWVKVAHSQLEEASWSASSAALRTVLPRASLNKIISHAAELLDAEPTVRQARLQPIARKCLVPVFAQAVPAAPSPCAVAGPPVTVVAVLPKRLQASSFLSQPVRCCRSSRPRELRSLLSATRMVNCMMCCTCCGSQTPTKGRTTSCSMVLALYKAS
jgi:hypothetical protein